MSCREPRTPVTLVFATVAFTRDAGLLRRDVFPDLSAPVFNVIDDYPCPDPKFQPPQGQSLEAFLKTWTPAQPFNPRAEMQVP